MSSSREEVYMAKFAEEIRPDFSSIAYSASEEIGSFRIGPNGHTLSLSLNPLVWNTKSSGKWALLGISGRHRLLLLNCIATEYSDDKHAAVGGSELGVSDDGFIVDDGEKYNGVGLKKRKARSDLCEDIELYTPASRKYECSTCKKGFNTYHGLATKKMKGCTAATSTMMNGSKNIVEMDVSVHCNAGTKKAGRVVGASHECLVCHKVFVSSQALGVTRGLT